MSAKINVTVAACAALCRGKVINMAPTGKMSPADVGKIRKSVWDKIAELLKGAIDPHVHSGPSIAPRGVDHLELRDQRAIPCRDFDAVSW